MRRLIAALFVAAVVVLAGCDDGPPAATGGDPDASTAQQASTLGVPDVRRPG